LVLGTYKTQKESSGVSILDKRGLTSSNGKKENKKGSKRK
jgi:hypothetical protein